MINSARSDDLVCGEQAPVVHARTADLALLAGSA